MAHFYIRRSDRPSIRRVKLSVLSALASRANAGRLLAELTVYACGGDAGFGIASVRAIGLAALRRDGVIADCLLALLKLLSRAEGAVLAEVVSVIAELLRRSRGTEDEAQTVRALCRKFATMTDVGARAAILQIVGDVHITHPSFGPSLLHFLANNFQALPGEVKLQSLALAAKVVVIGTESEIPLYLLKACTQDPAFDIRDRARLLLALLTAPSESLRAKAREILNPQKKPAKWTETATERQFVIGTLSQYFAREVGGYEPLPDWAEEADIPPASVRMPEKKAVVRRARSEEEEPGEEEDVDVNEFFETEKAAVERNDADDDAEEAAEEDAAEEEVDGEPEEDINGFFD
jgi:hypothetical protein